MRKKIVTLIILFICMFDLSHGVLTGFPATNDITKDPQNNCKWTGGSDTALVCVCLEENKELYITEGSIQPHNVGKINITNCHTLRFGPNAISSMSYLRSIELKRITSLIFETDSLYWMGIYDHINEWDSNIPSLKITVESSTVKQISSHAIKGRINQIIFKNVVIENIAPFGFSSLEHTREIRFYSTYFKEMLPQSFKKFATDVMIIKDSKFGTIPSRTFYDVVAKSEFILDNVTIDTLNPYGFIINNPHKFEILNSYINNLNGEGFKILTRGDVLIKNNVFNNTGVGAFRTISLNKDEEPNLQSFKLEKNIFHQVNQDSLIINETSFILKFSEIQIRQLCDCHNFERNFKNMKDTSALKCLTENSNFIAFDDFKTSNCTALKINVGIMVIIGIVCLVLLVLIIIGATCYIRKLYLCKRHEEDTDKQGKLNIIVPDGRTYRETELHVIVERADLLTTDL